MRYFSLLAVFILTTTATAQSIPTNVGTCTTSDTVNMQNTEAFAVLTNGGWPYLQVQKIVNGYIAVNEVLINDLICEKQKVSGFDSLICFSASSADKLILNVDTSAVNLPYKLAIFATTSSLKSRLSKAGFQMQEMGSNLVLTREYSATDQLRTCRF